MIWTVPLCWASVRHIWVIENSVVWIVLMNFFFNVKKDRKLLWNKMKKGLESRSNNFVLMSPILKLLPVIEHRPYAKSLQSCMTLQGYWLQAARLFLSMWFSRQEYWSGLPCPPLEDLLTQGSNLCLLHLLHCRQFLYCWVNGEAQPRSKH